MPNLTRKIKEIVKISDPTLPYDLTQYYPINSQKNLQQFWETYFPLVQLSLNYFGYSLNNSGLQPDHLGIQVNNRKEFISCHKKLMKISTLLSEEIVNKRWCSIYKFKKPPTTKGNIFIPRIEIYNPTPKQHNLEIKSGIEHVAFTVKNYSQFIKEWSSKKLPILYEKKIDNSTFFKTPFINGLLIEFRNDELGEWSHTFKKCNSG